MKLLIASDIHGSAYWCGRLCEEIEKENPDKVILLGDLLYQMVLPFPCLADYTELLADGKTFYLTHGHHQNPENLPSLPKGSLFLYGHTHVKLDRELDGIRCLNPGSVSIPKDGSHSCLIYEDGVFTFHIWEE